MEPAWSFVARGPVASPIVEIFTELAWQVGPERRQRTVVLDTADWRLHRAGLQVLLHEAPTRRLVITQAGSSPTGIDVDDTPRFVADLPAGPLRARLAPVVEMRALLPRLAFTDVATELTLPDAAGAVVGRAVVHHDIVIADIIIAERPHPLPVVLVDVRTQIGHTGTTQSLTERLEQQGCRRVPADLVATVLAAAGIDPDAARAGPPTELDPDAPAFDAMRDVLRSIDGAVRANWDGTLAAIDTEFLHDLRVALRRTRAVIGTSRAVFDDTGRRAAADRFRWLAGLTSAARDVDVQVLDWETLVATADQERAIALAPALAELRRRRDDAHTQLVDDLRSEAAEEALVQWRRWLDGSAPELVTPGPRATEPIGTVVARRVLAAHRRVVADGRRIGAASPAEDLHDLRKDAKRLRYLLECFAPLFDGEPFQRFVRHLKRLQDVLGRFQDGHVQADDYASLARAVADAGCDAATLVAIGEVRGGVIADAEAARRGFAERFAAFDTATARHDLKRALRGATS